MFWFFLIVRILVRLVWKGVQKDERSEDEDEEDEEEEKPVVEERKTRHAVNGQLKGPKVVLNGEPISPTSDFGTGMEVQDRKSTLRKR